MRDKYSSDPPQSHSKGINEIYSSDPLQTCSREINENEIDEY
jgi:hypothetical protein